MNYPTLRLLKVPKDAPDRLRQAINERNEVAEKANLALSETRSLIQLAEQEAQRDPCYDRTNAFCLTKAALETALVVMLADEPIFEAMLIMFDEGAAEHSRRGIKIRESIRAKLCIPDCIEHVPPSCLQQSKEYWQWIGGERKYANSMRMAITGSGGDIRAIREEITVLTARINNEPHRIKGAEEARSYSAQTIGVPASFNSESMQHVREVVARAHTYLD